MELQSLADFDAIAEREKAAQQKAEQATTATKHVSKVSLCCLRARIFIDRTCLTISCRLQAEQRKVMRATAKSNAKAQRGGNTVAQENPHQRNHYLANKFIKCKDAAQNHLS